MADVMSQIGDNLISGGISKISNAIGSIFSGGFGARSHGTAIAGALGAAISAAPGFANGTNFAPGGLAWVGERGKELVNLPRGSQVIPNHELSGGGRQAVDVRLVGGDLVLSDSGQIMTNVSARIERSASATEQRTLAKVPGRLSENRDRMGYG